MAKTNALRKLIKKNLSSLCEHVFYERADEETLYPHVVFSFGGINLEDLSRDDFILEIDVWDRSISAAEIEELCDKIEEKFNAENLPQDEILPVFFKAGRIPVRDEDVMIRHRLLKFSIQNYER